MQFDSFADFIAMGSHGPYVWACYGVTALVMAGCVLAPRLRLKKILLREQRLARRRNAAS